MWIILLDCSGSMGDPFSGNFIFEGRSRHSELRVKINAAKAALIEHLKGFGRTTEIVLIAFATDAWVIYEGRSDDESGIAASLERVQAGGDTNLWRGLDLTEQYLPRHGREGVIRLLAITDGLSERDPAVGSAQRLADAGVLIDVMLIDPTEEGEIVARAIAVNGTVTAVTSSEELSRGVETAMARAAEDDLDPAAAEEQAAQEEREAEEAASKVAQKERLRFTTSYCSTLTALKWYPVYVYLHLQQLQREVDQLLQRQGADWGELREQLSVDTLISRGSLIKLVPHADHIQFNPRVHEVAWFEDIQQVEFRAQAETVEKKLSVTGSIDIYRQQVLFAMLSLEFTILPEGTEVLDGSPVTSGASMFERVFVSYAHVDSPIVTPCVDAYQALGIEIYFDKKSLRSGQVWKNALRGFVEKSDVFQLFWSNQARQSSHVEDEWRHALSIAGRKGAQFIRPLFWELPMPTPPKELEPFHFSQLDLSHFASHAEERELKGAPSKNIYPAIVPVFPGSTKAVILDMHAAVSFAVNFLEEATGMRYYPAVTLLVEDYMVRATRAVNRVDLEGGQDLPLTVRSWMDVLQTIALNIHVNVVNPEGKHLKDLKASRFLLNEDQYAEILSLAEFIIIRWTTRYYRCEWQESVGRLKGCIPGIQLAEKGSAYVVAFLDSLMEIIHRRDKEFARQSIELECDLNVWKGLKESFDRAGVRLYNKGYEKRIHLQSPDDLIRMLEAIRQMLAVHLSECEKFDPFKGAWPSDVWASCEACGEALHAIQDRLAGLFGIFKGILPHWSVEEWSKDINPDGYILQEMFKLQGIIQGIARPDWRMRRDRLIGLELDPFNGNMGFVDCFDAYLAILERMLGIRLENYYDFEFRSQYNISQQTWDFLRKNAPELDLEAEGKELFNEKGKFDYVLKGRFPVFLDLFQRARTELMSELRSSGLRQATPLKQFFCVDRPTYGNFIPPDLETVNRELMAIAVKSKVPAELTLPWNPRVLYCLNGKERFGEMLLAMGLSHLESSGLADLFQVSVLIHEHFHALLELGVDPLSGDAKGPRQREAWQKAAGLNESLAVWMELHFARSMGDKRLEGLILTYIQAGSYPLWPYRGAQYVDELYAAQGMEVVQELIRSLRRDPLSAAVRFDALIGDESKQGYL